MPCHPDSHTQSKPHFAAIQPLAPQLAPAVLQSTVTTGSTKLACASLVSHSPLVPNLVHRSQHPRVSRVSAFSGAAIGFQSFAIAGAARRKLSRGRTSLKNSAMGTTALTETDIDEQVCGT